MTRGDETLTPSTPWLSVVMPIHDGTEFLNETMQSIAAEPTDGVEIIAIDSSGDSACKEIVEHYQHRLPIAYHHRADLKQWPAKTNAAVQMARGKFVSMLHQDDLWLPGRINVLQNALNNHPTMAVHLSPAYIVDVRSRRLGLWRCPLAGRQVAPQEDVVERLLIQNFIAIPAPLIRRDAWITVGGLDETLWYTADWDLYLKLAGAGDFVYEPSPTTAFRIHPESLTIRGSRDRHEFRTQMERVFQRHATKVGPKRLPAITKLASTSIEVNAALAATMNGNPAQILPAAKRLAALWPHQLFAYLRYSRLLERVTPRIKGILMRPRPH